MIAQAEKPEDAESSDAALPKSLDTITLYEARPPRVDDALSIAWMYEDLAKSGLRVDDVRAYPIASLAMGTVGAYVIGYARPEMWVKRINRKEDKYIGPKGLTDVWHSPYQALTRSTIATRCTSLKAKRKPRGLLSNGLCSTP